MKYKTPWLAVLWLVAAGSAFADLGRLGPEEFRDRSRDKPGIILDVRTPGEVSQGQIEGATVINIGDPTFAAKASLLMKDRPIYVYCLSGGRSNQAVRFLAEKGYEEVFNLEGGVLAWKRAKLPLVRPDTATAPEGEGISVADLEKTLSDTGLVLLDFFAPWCGPCRQVRPVVEGVSEAYEGRLEVIPVDVSRNPDIAQSFEVVAIPAFLLMKNGEAVERKTGTLTESEFRSFIDPHAAGSPAQQ